MIDDITRIGFIKMKALIFNSSIPPLLPGCNPFLLRNCKHQSSIKLFTGTVSVRSRRRRAKFLAWTVAVSVSRMAAVVRTQTTDELATFAEEFVRKTLELLKECRTAGFLQRSCKEQFGIAVLLKTWLHPFRSFLGSTEDIVFLIPHPSTGVVSLLQPGRLHSHVELIDVSIVSA